MPARAVALLLGIMLLWESPGYAQASRTKLIVAQGFVNVVPVGFWVAQERGFFRKYGLDVRIVHFRGSTQATQALIGGAVDVDMGSPPQFFNAIAAGVDLVELASLAPAMPYILVARPDIRSPQELRGKRFGTAGQGFSLAQLAEMVALRHYGLDPTKDASYLAIGPEPDRIGTMKRGLIDASVFGDEYRPQVEQQGMRVLADLGTLNLPWEHDMLDTKRSYLEAHRRTLENLLKGLLEANAYILNPQNKRFVMRIISENLHLPTVADAESRYTLARRLFVKKKPYPNVEGLRAMLRILKGFMPAVAKVRVSEVVDDSILRALDRSGWIDGLYKR